MKSNELQLTLLLTSEEPPPLAIENPNGTSHLVILCEHAANRIPSRLHNLSIETQELQRHIAWDIGALAVARRISQLLDAPLLFQCYSRLVIDCNRTLSSKDLILTESDGTTVPGNVDLSDAQRQQRIDEIWRPYQEGVADFLDLRRDKGLPTFLLILHSFTPMLGGVSRPWDLGLLYHSQDTPAVTVAQYLEEVNLDLVIGRNQPYVIELDEDYSVPVFGEQRRLPYLFVEIRQDRIETESGQECWADLLSSACRRWIKNG